MIYEGIEQGSDEWHALRIGRVTGSRISDVLAQGRGGAPSKERAKYLAAIVAERLTGKSAEMTFKSAAMERGNELEAKARKAYEWNQGVTVRQVTFVTHPDIEMAGASPDGLVGDDGGYETKCPDTHTHLGYLLGGSISKNYRDQVQWNMACTGRKWWDWCSYDDRLPGNRGAYHRRRIERDDEYIAMMEDEVRSFLREVEAMILKIDRATKFDPNDTLSEIIG